MEPRDPDWKARVHRAFAGQAMMRHLGIELVEAAPGASVLRAAIRPEVGQHHGYAHAALAFACGDTAAGMAAQSLMAADEGVLTIEMKINLLAPAKGEALVARGRVERAGRTVTVVRADVYAEDAGVERHVATMLGTMAVIRGLG